jgi:hypothetical protein
MAQPQNPLSAVLSLVAVKLHFYVESLGVEPTPAHRQSGVGGRRNKTPLRLRLGCKEIECAVLTLALWHDSESAAQNSLDRSLGTFVRLRFTNHLFLNDATSNSGFAGGFVCARADTIVTVNATPIGFSSMLLLILVETRRLKDIRLPLTSAAQE